MAASTEVAYRIDGFLRNVWIMATEELPENAAEWDGIGDAVPESVSWSLDWDQAVLGHLEELEKRSVAGEMTAEQSERYARLLVVLKEHLPLMDRLGITKPWIDLDAALARLQQAAAAERVHS